jgi:hypothetical protein
MDVSSSSASSTAETGDAQQPDAAKIVSAPPSLQTVSSLLSRESPPAANADSFIVMVATEEHFPYAEAICHQIQESAKARGTGIAKRSPEYVRLKMSEGKAVIALTREAEFAGFCYIETWGGKQYVANSGLIVVPKFREGGLAKRIKHAAFRLSREKYPDAKIFSITTSHAVMKMNTELGYVPVPFSELTQDDEFWNGCSSCPNFDILTRTNRKMCLCTGMLYDANAPKQVVQIDIPNTLSHAPAATALAASHAASDAPAVPSSASDAAAGNASGVHTSSSTHASHAAL